MYLRIQYTRLQYYYTISSKKDAIRAWSGAGKMSEDRRQLKSVLSPNVVTAFLAGLLMGNLNKNLVLGFLVGGIAATIFEQNRRTGNLPNVCDVWQNLRSKWRETNAQESPRLQG